MQNKATKFFSNSDREYLDKIYSKEFNNSMEQICFSRRNIKSMIKEAIENAPRYEFKK